MRGATGPTQALSFYFKTLQSTPHMRGATGHQYAALLSLGHFNPRPTCVGRLSSAATRGLLLYTSIHAPHAWGDFNGQFAAIIEEDTSIHAPHAWGDNNQQSNGIIKYTTSIHAPHAWGDALLTTLATALCTLQSTPHMRGATKYVLNLIPNQQTSIHAPHAWGDSLSNVKVSSRNLLQSTPHMRGATSM